MSDIAMAPEQSAIADTLVDDHTGIMAVSDAGEVARTEKEVEEAGLAPDEVEAVPALDEEQPQDEYAGPDDIQQAEADAQRQQQEQQQLEQPQEQPQEQFQPQQFTPQQEYQVLQQYATSALQDAYTNNLISPTVSESFTNDLFGAHCFPTDPVTGQVVPNPKAIGETMYVYGTNLIDTWASSERGQAMIQKAVEAKMEGLSEVAQSHVASRMWKEVSADTDFAKLKYGSEEFAQAMDKAEQIVEGLQWMQFPGKDGKPLPLHSKENLQKQFKVAINSLQAGRPRLDVIKQAVQTGRRLERENRVRKSAGNLGHGTSKGFQPAPDSDEEFWSNPASWNNYTNGKL